MKAKKDRKKRRKATEALKTRSKTSQKPPEQPRLDRDDVSAISEDDEDSDTTVTPATIQLPAHPQSAQDEQTEDIKEPADDVMNVDEEAEEPARAISTQPQRSASPEGLPSFPLPRHPNPPSTSELLRQGLDKALIGAEIVDPSRGLPIPDPGEPDEHNLGLGDRTCRRLRELGIVELFAGAD